VQTIQNQDLKFCSGGVYTKMRLFSWNAFTTFGSEKKLKQRFEGYNKTIAILYCRSPQTFLPEGHISYCTAVRGPDILRNVVVSK